MNILAASLTILSIFSTNHPLASSESERSKDHRISRSKDYPNSRGNDRWTQRDMEMWESFGRWRRERGRERERDRDRWTGDDQNNRSRDRWPGDDRSNRKSRKDRFPEDRSEPERGRDYPPQPEQPPVSRIPFQPLPIIIEPIKPPHVMPSIIERYPEVESTATYYPTESSVGYPTGTVSYSPMSSLIQISASYSPSSAVYSNAPTVKSTIAHIPPRHYNSSSSTTSAMAYASTVIVTTPESTVVTSVTGRYRAMSNSAGGSLGKSNWAGLISFALVLLSSLFIVSLV